MPSKFMQFQIFDRFAILFGAQAHFIHVGHAAHDIILMHTEFKAVKLRKIYQKNKKKKKTSTKKQKA